MARQARHAQLVSVILPARNAAATIAEQLQALEKQTYGGGWEIVVVDNRSDDGTAAVVRAWEPRLPHLRLVEAHERRGHAYPRNVGVAVSAGDLLAFCDADDVVDPHWLEHLVQAAASFDAVGGGIDLQLLNDPTVAQWRAGVVPEEHPMSMLGFLPFAWTANLAVWRNVFEAVGGFPLAEGGGADVAFSWRLQISGFTLGYERDALVHYRMRPDLKGLFAQYQRYGMSAAWLYKEYRAWGAQRRPLRATVRDWRRVVLGVRHLFQGPVARGQWVRRVAFETGQLRGAWRHRVLFAG